MHNIESMVVTHWSEFGLRPNPSMSARSRSQIPEPLRAVVDHRRELMREPFVGITANGEVEPDLFDWSPTAVSTAPITEAALAFLDALNAEHRERVQFALDGAEWRTWINVHMNFFRHGVMLEELSPAGRSLGLDLLRATLSARGYAQARDIMRLNEMLNALTGRIDEYGEWPYFISIFGTPSADEPWGWQLDGHHLNVNCLVVGDQMVMTPTFMGSEPCKADTGPYAGISVFEREERGGLDLIRSLDNAQAAKAVLWPSIHPDDLPAHLQQPFDGRMQAGAFLDNAVIGCEGVAATDLSDAQRRLLSNLIAAFVGWTNEGHAEVKMSDVEDHLDETWFAWMGSTGDGPFYYRVQSPVVLIEFDHLPGIVFDNDVPSRHHVHSIIRTPNGGDYGADLLRQHHERYDHSTGRHEHHHGSEDRRRERS